MTQGALDGRTAVVTGASRGIGRFVAELFASHGAAIGICARNPEHLDTARSELEAATSARVVAGALDVTDRAAMAGFAKQVTEAAGAPDIVVNNAGALGPIGPLERISLEEWEQALLVNVMGTLNTTAAFLPAMIEKGRGSVINLSGAGAGGPRPWPRIGAYSASKTAVVSLTETLALELAAHGIRVNAVAPGGLDTGFMDPVIEAGPEVAGQGLYDAMLKLDDPGAGALDRFATLLLYLVSDEATWLTGRLLSARWETVDVLEQGRDRIEGSSLFTLRRIDDALFTSVPDGPPSTDPSA